VSSTQPIGFDSAEQHPARPLGKGEYKLVVRWMGGAEQEYPLDKASLRVGRNAGNDIIVDHQTVSGTHLILEASNGAFTVTDLNSTNGTLINGQRINPGTPHKLQLGDVIRIGDLQGNWVTLNLELEGWEAHGRLSLGQINLSKMASGTIGRAPDSFLPLNHPTVSYRHAMLSKEAGGITIRDLGSTNGTFVNRRRIKKIPVPLHDLDSIQIGTFRLIYDARSQSLSQSVNLGYRIDMLGLGRVVPKNKLILQDIDLTINPGEFVALVGGSGAGKSTLLKALNGYEPATQGQILIDGEPLYPRLDLYRTQMGYVPQDDIIHRVLPVRLALWYAARLRLPDARPPEIEARIREALKSVDMLEHADKPVRVLSGGQRKRVSIAVELLAHPALFFLDEPTTGLDPGLEKKMMYDLARLADQGRAVVLVTHATANIDQCDQVAFLADGRLVFYGSPDDALQFYNVRDFADIYLKLSQEIDPTQGKFPSLEIKPLYTQASRKGDKPTSGALWAEHFRQSPFFQKYIADRQRRLDAGAAAPQAEKKYPPRARDSFLRQTLVLARRQIDLIRFDMRTLLTLLLIVPVIGILFGGVSKPYAFKGEVTYDSPEVDTFGEIVEYHKEQLKDKTPGSSEAEILYIPIAGARQLVNMVALAIVQAGTFIAAFEIVKEKAIFQRERAVNLKVLSYLLSKLLVLGGVAVFHVLSMLVILWLFGVDLDVPGAVFKNSAQLELFITFYLGMLTGITFGLLISTIMPSTELVLFVVLIQLFAQIILNGTLFQIDNPTVPQMTPTYWTTVGIGSIVDLPELNSRGMACKVVEFQDPVSGVKSNQVQCSASRARLLPGGKAENKDGDYRHSPGRVITTWIVLIMQGVVFFMLTLIFLWRRR
jgi:ABC-type multidrug transport system ATPase subunit